MPFFRLLSCCFYPGLIFQSLGLYFCKILPFFPPQFESNSSLFTLNIIDIRQFTFFTILDLFICKDMLTMHSLAGNIWNLNKCTACRRFKRLLCMKNYIFNNSLQQTSWYAQTFFSEQSETFDKNSDKLAFVRFASSACISFTSPCFKRILTFGPSLLRKEKIGKLAQSFIILLSWSSRPTKFLFWWEITGC